mgnify:CR=1 FL=1
MNEDATIPDTVDTSLSIPVIIIELLPSKNASSPIDTSSLSVVSLPLTLPVSADSTQGLLSLENARVSPI